jgi:hypothetical protein
MVVPLNDRKRRNAILILKGNMNRLFTTYVQFCGHSADELRQHFLTGKEKR